jgi:hypothetical protein
MLLLSVIASPVSAEIPSFAMVRSSGCHAHRQTHPTIGQLDYQCCATGHNSALLRTTFEPIPSLTVFRVAGIPLTPHFFVTKPELAFWTWSSGSPVLMPLLI